MMTVSLSPSAREKLRTHFFALPAEDRRMRFGGTMSDAAVDAYVERLNFERDFLFGIFGDRLQLVGVGHLAMADKVAEFGVSVVPGHRRHGIGSALVSRAAVHARNHAVPLLFMHCLSDNHQIIRIAGRLGMQIVRDGSESEAHLPLPRATFASVAGELMEEGIALCDHSFRTRFLAARKLAERAGMVAPRRTKEERAEEVTPG
jgi:RimJ/RimL family protein N-acetyltransferase